MKRPPFCATHCRICRWCMSRSRRKPPRERSQLQLKEKNLRPKENPRSKHRQLLPSRRHRSHRPSPSRRKSSRKATDPEVVEALSSAAGYLGYETETCRQQRRQLQSDRQGEKENRRLEDRRGFSRRGRGGRLALRQRQ